MPAFDELRDKLQDRLQHCFDVDAEELHRLRRLYVTRTRRLDKLVRLRDDLRSQKASLTSCFPEELTAEPAVRQCITRTATSYVRTDERIRVQSAAFWGHFRAAFILGLIVWMFNRLGPWALIPPFTSAMAEAPSKVIRRIANNNANLSILCIVFAAAGIAYARLTGLSNEQTAAMLSRPFLYDDAGGYTLETAWLFVVWSAVFIQVSVLLSVLES